MALAFCGIMVLAILARLPFMSHIAADEAFYLVVGRQWLHGSLPYAATFDVKPPGLFALMAASESLFGASALASKALGMAATGATAFALYLFGRRISGEISGAVSALLYIASSLALSRSNVTAELLMAPFTATGMLIAFPAAFRRCPVRLPVLFFAGACFGATASIKQTAVFESFPLFLILIAKCSSPRPWLSAVALAAGGAVLPACFAFYYLARGHFEALFSDAVLSALVRVNAENVSLHDALLEWLPAVIAFLPVIVMAGLFLAARASLPIQSGRQIRLFLIAWTAGAFLGVVAARGVLYFYYLPLLSPLCLAAGAYVERAPGRSSSFERRQIYRSILTIGAVFYMLWRLGGVSFPAPESREAAEAASAAMRHAQLRRGESILAVDAGLYAYIAARASPPGAIFHPRQLLCELNAQSKNALLDALNRKPAFIIVAKPPLARKCEIPERRIDLQARLADAYCELRGDPQEPLSVYGLRERPATPCR